MTPAQPAPFVEFTPISRPPLAAGYITAFSASAGFAATSLGMPSSGRAFLPGVDLSAAADSGKLLGAKFDLSYASTANLFNSGRRGDVLTYMAGPTFSVYHSNALTAWAHVLGGGARVAGYIGNTSSGLLFGHVNYPAWAVGGDAEYRLSPGIGLRVSVDYLRTHFYDTSGAVRGQNSMRVVNSIVYYIGEPFRGRRPRRWHLF